MPATFTNGFAPVPAATVKAVERRLGVKLPADYKRFLATTNGGRPDPDGFAIPGCGDALLDFLYGVRGKRLALDLEQEQVRAQAMDPLPAGFLVIGKDPGGNALLLDTTAGGAVYYWDRAWAFPGSNADGNTYPVAESFTAFLKLLRALPTSYQGVQFANALPRVSAAAVRKAEKQLGVTLPDDYRAFLLAVNGGIPTPSEFDMAKPGRPGERIVIDLLYGIGRTREYYDLQYHQEQILDRTGSLPDGFVTIGYDPGAAPYFIGTRGKTAGTIYFFDPSGFLDPGKKPRLYVAAKNFADLLRRLAAG